MYIIMQKTIAIFELKESFILLQVTLWVYFMNKITFYSHVCLFLMVKNHSMFVQYIGIKFN